MSQLSRDIRKNVRSNVSVPGVIVDIFYGRASVRLTSNGAIYRNLDVVGGPVVPGQQVRVDFTTAKPTIVATGQKGLSLDDIKKMLGQDNGRGNDTQITITLFSGGAIKQMYPPNETGFGQALTDSYPGDVIFMPDVDLTGDFTIPASIGITGLNREQSIIRGSIYMLANSYMQGMAILPELNMSFGYGVRMRGGCKLESCFVFTLNSGSSIGVYMIDGVADGTPCYCNDNIVYASVGSDGLGYAYYSLDTYAYITGGVARGTTAPFGGSGSYDLAP